MKQPRGAVAGRAARILAVHCLGLLACFLVLGVAGVRPAAAAQATISWDAVAAPDLAGYKVHYGTASGAYSTHIDVGNVLNKVIDNLVSNTTYYFVVTAYDSYGGESANSAEVVSTPAPQPETLSAPSAASGPTSGVAGGLYTYTTGGAVSSTGDPVQYQFFWSDGTASGWLPAGTTAASKAWPTPGTYSDIRVQARCATHPSIVSSLSASIAVVIAAAPPESVSTPFAPIGPARGVAGQAYTYATGGSVTSAGDPVQYRFTWADGTVSEWLPVGVTEAVKTWAAPGTYADVRVEARCAVHPSVTSAPSSPLTVVIESGALETVSPPSAPAGPTEGSAGTSYAFSSSGAVSDAGDPVQYRFHWGDGTVTDWLAAGVSSASKAWEAPGTYRVQVEAACALHPTVTALSPEVEVVIGGPDPLLFMDDFKDGGPKGDPDWRAFRGTWKVGGKRMSLEAPVGARTLSLARPVRGYSTGRLSFKIRLGQAGTGMPNTGLVFAAHGTTRYRYVAINTSWVVIGQVGETSFEKAGVKRSAATRLAVRKWHRVDVSLLPDGTVEVYLNGAVRPAVSHRFIDLVPGMVGFYTQNVPALYDDFAVRDESALY